MPLPTPRPARWQRRFVYGSFLVGSLVALWVPFFNRVEPSLGGIPFFYWFQVAWVVVMAGLTALAYRLGA